MITLEDKVKLLTNTFTDSVKNFSSRFDLVKEGLGAQTKINSLTDTQIKQLEAQIDSLRTAIFTILGIQGATLILIYFMI